MMAYAHLQKEVEESKLEIRRLRERMSLGAPTIYKELLLSHLSRSGQAQSRRII